MRVAGLYDIHGNLPALEAVLEEVHRAGVDRIVVGGDVVPGPMPRETLQRLLRLDLPVQFVHGNGDLAVLASWPKTVRIEIPRLGRVLACHGTPRSETEVFSRLTAEDRLLPIFDGLGVAVVVCGHTHMQFDRMVGRTRVVNAGSVGLPAGEPGAHWVLLGPDVELRRTAYDRAGAAERFRGTQYPRADDVAKQVLEPPSERDMLDFVSKHELMEGG